MKLFARLLNNILTNIVGSVCIEISWILSNLGAIKLADKFYSLGCYFYGNYRD